ncbi:hypothetical protein F4815DRAFT_24875 [Daldinia loculata]|nr:hypothetical protein F4815DRAFT_24875 [Daldinia loculata]
MAVNSQAGGMFMKPDMCIWIMWAPPNRCSLKTIGVLSAAVLMDYGVVGVVNYLGSLPYLHAAHYDPSALSKMYIDEVKCVRYLCNIVFLTGIELILLFYT